MLNRKNKQENKGKKSKVITYLLLAFVLIFSSGTFPVSTEAEIISRGESLKQVGPINESNGFPLWYKDSNDVKLELCLDPQTNNLCGLVAEDFDSNQPISFPDNYPGEAFYQLAEAAMESPDGRSDAIATFALEATFNSEAPAMGDQTVFGRVRFRIDGLTTGSTYRITHPYGVDEIVAEDGEINYTEDIGAGQTFAGALNSRIGTFLKAVDPAPPEGYVGNPNIDQTVTGGVNNQNFFQIEGPGIGNVYPNDRCTSTSTDCIKTTLFSLAGKISVNNGLDIQQATYKQTSSNGGSIDVFVYSEVGQIIEVSGDGIVSTILSEGNGQYYAHIPYTGAEPTKEITVTNFSDEAKTTKKTALVDRITATADYAPETKTLMVTAKSSDEVEPPKLTVNGFGDINPETRTLIVKDLSYIPSTITITSSNEGTVTVPVNIVIGANVGEDPVANAGLDKTDILQGALVTLDGTGSQNAMAFSWKQLSGPPVALSLADTANPTFFYPKYPYSVVFELTVTGADGTTSKDTVEISTLSDNLEVISAENRRGSWRISGTSDVFGPGVRIIIKVVDTANPDGIRIGSAFVDQSGNWRFSSKGQTISDEATLTIESSSGGKLTGVPITKIQ